MKINYIKVRGAIGFKKGLGVDEVEYDLTNKTGLVALSGPNGRGKTTLLELMSPYRTFASRKGALRHHFFLRDSFIETRFEYNGNQYHTIRKIDSGSDRAEAFIVVDGESVVNGKLKEYDDYVIDLFGSQALFYNSVFCAQGSGNMSDMRTGEIKELFVEFLRIERFVEYETKSKQGIALYQKKIDVLSGQIEVCQESIDYFDNIEADLSKNKDEIVDTERMIEMSDEGLEKISSEIEGLKKKEIEQAHDINRKKELESTLEKLIASRSEIEKKIGLLNWHLNNSRDSIKNDMASIDSILAEKESILSASQKIEKYRRGEKHFLDCFECSMDEQGRLDKNMKSQDATIQAIKDRVQELKNDLIQDGMATTIGWLKDQMVKKKHDKDNLSFSMIRAKQDVKDCKEKIAMAIDPDCKSTICPALFIVQDATKDLPGFEKTLLDLEPKEKGLYDIITDLNSKEKKCKDDLDDYVKDLSVKINVLLADEKELSDKKDKTVSDYLIVDEFKTFYKGRLTIYRDRIRGLETLAATKPQIEIAEEKKKGLEKQMETLVKDYEARAKEHRETSDNITGEIADNELILNAINLDLESVNVKERLEAKTIEKETMGRNKKNLSDSLNRLNESAAILKNDLEKKNENILSLKNKKADLNKFQKEYSEWDYLRLACSKTGLQALEIDGAAPLIVREANSLLEQAFGLDSQIRIVTQDPESGREVFWIKVIREDGSEDDFGNLSGGQKVWIAKALSLGMTLVSKRKSGRDFMTLFADEEDGALDSEKALEFVQLYRSMMSTGDFETCFFISHNPEVVAMADHEIKF